MKTEEKHMEKQKELLRQYFPQFVNFYDQLDKLAYLIEEKSRVLNITAIREYEKIWEKHILDSLMCSKIKIVEQKLQASSVLDLGTGGGLPGLPLSVTYKKSEFTLLDSTKKKLNAVDEFASELGLANVKTEWARSEEYAVKSPKNFDVVVSRAVAYLPELLTICKPFIKDTGLIVLYKLSNDDELKAGREEAAKLGLTLKEKYEYEIDNSSRVILVYAAA